MFQGGGPRPQRAMGSQVRVCVQDERQRFHRSSGPLHAASLRPKGNNHNINHRFADGICQERSVRLMLYM